MVWTCIKSVAFVTQEMQDRLPWKGGTEYIIRRDSYTVGNSATAPKIDSRKHFISVNKDEKRVENKHRILGPTFTELR